MKLTVKTAVIGAVIASAAVLAAPGTASADTGACPSGKVCLYDGHNETGEFLAIDGDVANVGAAWNDRVSSIWNNSNLHVCTYSDANYSGEYDWQVLPGEKQELLFYYDNSLTSIEAHVGFGCGG